MKKQITTVLSLLFLQSCAISPPLKFSYIDKTGQAVIKGPFNWAEDFSEGLAPVRASNQNSGFIDRTGKFVIEPKFGNVHAFVDGLARASSSGRVVIESQLRRVDGKDTAHITNPENLCYGFIDKQGNWVIQPQFMEASDFSEGLAWVGHQTTLQDGSGHQWGRKSGYINKHGQFVFAVDGANSAETSGCLCSADSESCKFVDGLAPFLKTPENKWGYIDKTGKFIIAPEFESACAFVNGFARVTTAQGMSFINRKGRFVSDCFSLARNFSDGMAAVRPGSEWSAKWGYINTSGKMVIEPLFSEVADFSEGYAVVLTQTKIDPSEIAKRETWDIRLQRALGLGDFIITNNYRDKTWVIDHTGKKISIDLGDGWPPGLTQNCFANRFAEGLLGVRRAEGVGFVNKEGKIIISPRWQAAGNFHEGLAHVCLKTK